MWTCFKFWPTKNVFLKLKANESLIMACLQICQELLSLATFLRVQSNSKEVSHFCWQNTCLNLKTTCHVKLKFSLWTKLLENLLLAKYLISVAATLADFSCQLFSQKNSIYFWMGSKCASAYFLMKGIVWCYSSNNGFAKHCLVLLMFCKILYLEYLVKHGFKGCQVVHISRKVSGRFK